MLCSLTLMSEGASVSQRIEAAIRSSHMPRGSPTDKAKRMHAKLLVALHLIVERVWPPGLREKDNADLRKGRCGISGGGMALHR